MIAGENHAKFFIVIALFAKKCSVGASLGWLFFQSAPPFLLACSLKSTLQYAASLFPLPLAATCHTPLHWLATFVLQYTSSQTAVGRERKGARERGRLVRCGLIDARVVIHCCVVPVQTSMLAH